MSRRLDDLSSAMRPLAFEFLARLAEAGIAVMIVDTLRTEEEHAENLANGTSRATVSNHLPRRMRTTLPPTNPLDGGKSDAMDVCPYDVYQIAGADKLKWDADAAIWQQIGVIAEQVGLEWGGRWKKPYDPGHVQLPRLHWT